MKARSLFALLAVLALPAGATLLSRAPAAPLPAAAAGPPRAFLPPGPELFRSRCAFSGPLTISVRALGTALVGQPLTLEITARNTRLPGPFECRLRVPDGALVPLDGELAWSPDLPPGQAVTWTTRVRPATSDAIPITAKVRSLAPPYDAIAPRESYLTLYPFDASRGGLSAGWEPHRAARARPLVTLPGGDRAVLCDPVAAPTP